MEMMDRLRREESGMTLTELMITVALLVLVTAALLTFLDSMNRAVLEETQRSQANDQARLAIEQMDREIRSGNYIYDPQNEPSPYQYLQLRVYTQANAPTRTPAVQCVQWRIEDSELLRRSWPTGDPGAASDWRVVAENIVNAHPSVDEAAFTIDNGATGGRTVDISLYVDVDPDDTQSQPVRLDTSLTARNTPSGYTSSVCNPAPSDDDDDD
jgi:type II secretory pathway component PulJ